MNNETRHDDDDDDFDFSKLVGEPLVDQEYLTSRLESHFSSPDYRPPVLPAIALEIHQLAQYPEVDLQRVAALLEKDSLLAARVLRVANSPAYAMRGRLVSLRDAVVRLGARSIRDIVWEIALNMRVFKAQRYAGPMESVRKHSTTTAYLARLVSSLTSLANDYAFLCGLLHDIGIASALVVLEERMASEAPLDDLLLAYVFNVFHEDGSSLIAKLWSLPPDVQVVLGHHHNPMIDGQVHPLGAVVNIADALATELGAAAQIGEHRCDATEDEHLQNAIHALNLKSDEMEELRSQAQKLIAALS